MGDFDRRDFLKLVGVGAGSAAAAGCSDHVEKLIPYVVQPEEITPGIAVTYASTCRECSAGCGLHVTTREARPIKLEGNPDHPVNRGGLCARGQAGIGRAYSPDRFSGPMRRDENGELQPVSWDEAIALVADKIREAPGRTWVLGGDRGPTVGSVIDRFVTAIGGGGRVVYEPFAEEAVREAARQVFGVASDPVFDLSGADLVIDFGSEFLESGASPAEHTRQWAEARSIEGHADGGARFVTVGPRLSTTASNADEWLAAQPGTEGILALALTRAAIEAGAGGAEHRALRRGLLAEFGAEAAAAKTGVPAETIQRLGRALARAKRPMALPPGVALRSRRAVHTAGAVLLLNHVVGAVGRGVRIPPASDRRRASYRDVLSLVQDMQDGTVGVLFIHDANPVYSVPAGFDEALGKVGLTVSLASSADETSTRADLVLPDHAPLESWGDAEPRPGVRSLEQPTLRPLYDTRALPDTLLEIGRRISPAVASRLPSGSFRGILQQAWSDTDWNRALARGGVFRDLPEAAVALAPGASRLAVVEPKLAGAGDFVLVAFPHGFLGDGRGASLPWLQEIPDNVTKIAWQSWAEISLASASRLGVELGDVIAIETSSGRLEVPVYPRGGIRDDVVAVPMGQGHTVGAFASREGEARGVNVAAVLPRDGVDENGGRAWLTERAKVSATGRAERVALVQLSDNKRGRQLAEVVPLAALGAANGHGDHGTPHVSAAPHGEEKGHGDHGGGHGDAHGGGHGEAHVIREPYDPKADAKAGNPYRWGMTVDLDRCTGCSACVAACYVENNVAVVGEQETLLARQMAWLRIERYVGEGSPDLPVGRVHPQENHERLGDVDVRHSAMMCQQCGAAPCEPVCPVIATYHNDEGLNAMIYNRCIGTRYCANNCPYKVRRFNYFDNQLTKWPEPMRLMLNPDVTVRGQGVMEKCNFCVQRIKTANQAARDEGRNIDSAEVQTACQQSCPAEAIAFGNLRDEKSAVAKLADDPARGYHALHSVNTRPATTYLRKVVRGKVEG